MIKKNRWAEDTTVEATAGIALGAEAEVGAELLGNLLGLSVGVAEGRILGSTEGDPKEGTLVGATDCKVGVAVGEELGVSVVGAALGVVEVGVSVLGVAELGVSVLGVIVGSCV
jgi:hypothetical protein